jgi:hypothetical protein
VPSDLKNLAKLLQDTDRLSEAEEHCQRAIYFVLDFNARTGHEHPDFQLIQKNYQ